MIAADYAMAWNEDIDAIGTYGLCHGSYAVGMVELERDFLVAFRLPYGISSNEVHTCF